MQRTLFTSRALRLLAFCFAGIALAGILVACLLEPSYNISRIVTIEGVHDARTRSGSVVFGGQGICYRSTAEDSWSCNAGVYGSASYKRAGLLLPDYTNDSINAVGPFAASFAGTPLGQLVCCTPVTESDAPKALLSGVALFFGLSIATSFIAKEAGRRESNMILQLVSS